MMEEELMATEMRSRIYAELYGESADSHNVSTPFTRNDHEEMCIKIGVDVPDDEATSLAVLGSLLREIMDDEIDWEERSAGPMNKEEMASFIEYLEESDDEEDEDAPFALIGTEDMSQSGPSREEEPVKPHNSPMRYMTLCALARLGPGTARELGKEADAEDFPENLTWSTVESELPRLYRMKMADRSNTPGFDNNYTYWLSEKGEEVLLENGNLLETDDTAKHSDLRFLYGNE
jgi:hypothetical protein